MGEPFTGWTGPSSCPDCIHNLRDHGPDGCTADRLRCACTHARVMCPDCRCFLTVHNQIWPNDSAYCDYCLRDRVKTGERVPGPSYTDEHDVRRHVFYVVCTRCEGSGEYIVSAWQRGTDCFRCMGKGFIDPDREETRRMQCWSSTYQTNREPGKRVEEKPRVTYPRRRRSRKVI